VEFPSTLWTQILEAQQDPKGAREKVFARYWEPMFHYLQAKGVAREDAEDLTQTVFLHLTRQPLLERADRAKGRFRQLLKAVATNLLNMWLREGYAKKRGGDGAKASLDDGLLLEIADQAGGVGDPQFDASFDKGLLRSALARLKEESDERKTPYHAALELLYLEGKSYREITAALGVDEGVLKNYVHRGKVKLGEYIREEVRAYASSKEEYDEELKRLGG